MATKGNTLSKKAAPQPTPGSKNNIKRKAETKSSDKPPAKRVRKGMGGDVPGGDGGEEIVTAEDKIHAMIAGIENGEDGLGKTRQKIKGGGGDEGKEFTTGPIQTPEASVSTPAGKANSASQSTKDKDAGTDSDETLSTYSDANWITDDDTISADSVETSIKGKKSAAKTPSSKMNKSAPANTTKEANSASQSTKDKDSGAASNTSTGKGKESASIANPRETSATTSADTSKNSNTTYPKTKTTEASRNRRKSRGTTGNTSHKKPYTSNNYVIRRILAQRSVDEKKEKIFYKVDWFPTWVSAAAPAIRRRPEVVQEWDQNTAAHTIRWGHDTVYKVLNPTSDDESALVRQVIDTVLEKYTAYMSPDTSTTGRTAESLAADLFIDTDWTFPDDSANDAELRFAHADTESIDLPSAAEVLRASFVGTHTHHSANPEDPLLLPYRNVRILFAGTAADEDQSPLTVASCITPLFAPALHDPQIMTVATWDAAKMQQQTSVLRPAVEELIRHCPFLLTPRPGNAWPLALISLFFWGDEVTDKVTEDLSVFEAEGEDEKGQTWKGNVRDLIVYTYLEENEWEMRCMDELWTSFTVAQDFIQGEADAAEVGGDEGEDGEEGEEQEDVGGGKAVGGKKDKYYIKPPGKKGNTGKGAGQKGRGAGQKGKGVGKK